MVNGEKLIDEVKCYKNKIDGLCKRITDIDSEVSNGLMSKENAQKVIKGLESELQECSVNLEAMEYVLLSQGRNFPTIKLAVKSSSLISLLRNPEKLMERRMKKILKNNLYEKVGENTIDIKPKDSQMDHRFGNCVEKYDKEINLFSTSHDEKEELVEQLYI